MLCFLLAYVFIVIFMPLSVFLNSFFILFYSFFIYFDWSFKWSKVIIGAFFYSCRWTNEQLICCESSGAKKNYLRYISDVQEICVLADFQLSLTGRSHSPATDWSFGRTASFLLFVLYNFVALEIWSGLVLQKNFERFDWVALQVSPSQNTHTRPSIRRKNKLK